jgi:glycosyltransferase involved in cell wall biosynthesis
MDYRSALRGRSGVGEYAHQLLRALVGQNGAATRVDATIFSSSWKDRLHLPADIAGVQAIDRRVPVSVLNFAWHRLEWPTIERLTHATFDVAHSLHPLMMPAKHAAQVITIHDLNFVKHPERTRKEIRRDYPALAENHARRASRIVVPSAFTAGEVERSFDIDQPKITICSPGAPDWSARPRAPHDGYILFLGTLEPRKNVGTLLDAYERLLAQSPEPKLGPTYGRSPDLKVGPTDGGGPTDVPDLVLAGQAIDESKPWLERIARPPLRGRVRHIGYVEPEQRLAVFDGARFLVQPSFEEGFGIPVLEAMTRGVPVVAANRGALPEVLGDAGLLFDAASADDLAEAMRRMTSDATLVRESTQRGLARARQFRWSEAADRMIGAYEEAIAHRQRLDIIDDHGHGH